MTAARDKFHDQWKDKNKLIDGVLHRRCYRCQVMKEISHFKRLSPRKNTPRLGYSCAVPSHRSKFSRNCIECETRE